MRVRDHEIVVVWAWRGGRSSVALIGATAGGLTTSVSVGNGGWQRDETGGRLGDPGWLLGGLAAASQHVRILVCQSRPGVSVLVLSSSSFAIAFSRPACLLVVGLAFLFGVAIGGRLRAQVDRLGFFGMGQLPADVAQQRAAPVIAQGFEGRGIVALNPQVGGPLVNHGQDGGIDLRLFGEGDALSRAGFRRLQQGVEFLPILHMPFMRGRIDRPAQAQIFFIERRDLAVVVHPDQAGGRIA